MAEGRSTILVLHPSSTDPSGFLQPSSSKSTPATISKDNEGESSTPGRTNDDDIQQGESSTSGITSYTSASVPWEIENKYYTASVNFTAYPQEIFEMKEAEGVEVIMYIFEGNVNSLPPGLVKVMATPRDIALAIRIRGDNARQDREEPNEAEGERMEDLFDEVGMEYMDESSLPEDDDERPISIEERIRQTLMTHMWPNMIRKPIPSRMDMGFEDDDEDYNEGDDDVDHETEAEFPVTFNPLQSRAPTNDLDRSANPDDFPGLDELRNQIMLEDLDKRQGDHGFSRLDMMNDLDDFEVDDGGDWVGAEYAKLDDWLDENENENENGGEDTTHDHDDEIPTGDPDLDIASEDQLERDNSGPIDQLEESQFEDDFADFAPFHSAPPPRSAGGEGAAGGIDPTPLLLHLQNVREELAGLDEDTRRERAGKEVESVLMSLGLGGLGGSDWEDEI